MTRELVVGVDVGSQGTCAQAIAPDGELVATTYVPHTLSYPQPGWAEQDARDWLGAVAQALSEVRRAVGRAAVRAVSFGSQLDGLVAADAAGQPLGPALIWMDRRAGAQCERAAERIDPGRLRELSGCNLDPGHVAAKIAWLAEHRADQHAGARWFLLPGSFVAWQASGELVGEPRYGRPAVGTTAAASRAQGTLRRAVRAPPGALRRASAAVLLRRIGGPGWFRDPPIAAMLPALRMGAPLPCQRREG